MCSVLFGFEQLCLTIGIIGYSVASPVYCQVIEHTTLHMNEQSSKSFVSIHAGKVTRILYLVTH